MSSESSRSGRPASRITSTIEHAMTGIVHYRLPAEADLEIVPTSGTSDFIADCLVQWWEANKARYPNARRLVINLDNGPENLSHRTQFMNRIGKFADSTGLEIKLVYYPPYHSKQVQPHRSRRVGNTRDSTAKPKWPRAKCWAMGCAEGESDFLNPNRASPKFRADGSR